MAQDRAEPPDRAEVDADALRRAMRQVERAERLLELRRRRLERLLDRLQRPEGLRLVRPGYELPDCRIRGSRWRPFRRPRSRHWAAPASGHPTQQDTGFPYAPLSTTPVD